ncbi:uncharacterized protein LOC132251320 isoform X2 [Alligator mississippiensis]|uniref:uncharacterized protein LOC132251320 isoform X2 n=1 Tax=Alligator mississippiensis TaxID=8496 RepID=UPI0028772DDF|nr:uncharacterized protein LOC132251320 isoform X2 [Alligator mississippiensis]
MGRSPMASTAHGRAEGGRGSRVVEKMPTELEPVAAARRPFAAQITASVKVEEISPDKMQPTVSLQEPGDCWLEQPKARCTDRHREEAGLGETTGPQDKTPHVPKEQPSSDQKSDSPKTEETWDCAPDESCSGSYPGQSPSPGAGTFSRADEQPPEEVPVFLELQRTCPGRMGEMDSLIPQPGQLGKGQGMPPKQGSCGLDGTAWRAAFSPWAAFCPPLLQVHCDTPPPIGNVWGEAWGAHVPPDRESMGARQLWPHRHCQHLRELAQTREAAVTHAATTRKHNTAVSATEPSKSPPAWPRPWSV